MKIHTLRQVLLTECRFTLNLLLEMSGHVLDGDLDEPSDLGPLHLLVQHSLPGPNKANVFNITEDVIFTLNLKNHRHVQLRVNE